MSTTTRAIPTAIEVLTLPVDQLIDMLGAHLAEIDPETLGRLGSRFLGTLIRRTDDVLVFGMPAGQDPEQREDVIRTLILRDIAHQA